MISTVEKRTISLENNTNLLDISFSSYLNEPQDASFIRKLQSQTGYPLVPVSPQSTYIGKKKVEDGEIGIFGAEKYFTGAIDKDVAVIPKGNNQNLIYKQERDQEVVLDKRKAQSATPSVCSEASWNSRSAFLQNYPKNQQRKEANKVKSFFAVLGCNCNGKSSVEINEKAGDLVVKTTNKSLSSRWSEEETQTKNLNLNMKREECFSFPVMNPKAGDQVVKVHLHEEKEIVRNSLEVFGSPIMEKAKKSFNLERKLTMLNWDGVTPRVNNIKIPQNEMYDSESDASSDLFEIESFSTNPKPSNAYAPSEASIDWSVATASAADVAVISAYKEIRNGTAKNSSVIAWNMKPEKAGREVVLKKTPTTSILSGCKSVRVAGDEYRTTMVADRAEMGSPQRRLRLDSATPITKIQAEAKLTGFDSRSRVQNGFGARPLPRYIQ